MNTQEDYIKWLLSRKHIASKKLNLLRAQPKIINPTIFEILNKMKQKMHRVHMKSKPMIPDDPLSKKL